MCFCSPSLLILSVCLQLCYYVRKTACSQKWCPSSETVWNWRWDCRFFLQCHFLFSFLILWKKWISIEMMDLIESFTRITILLMGIIIHQILRSWTEANQTKRNEYSHRNLKPKFWFVRKMEWNGSCIAWCVFFWRLFHSLFLSFCYLYRYKHICLHTLAYRNLLSRFRCFGTLVCCNRILILFSEYSDLVLFVYLNAGAKSRFTRSDKSLSMQKPLKFISILNGVRDWIVSSSIFVCLFWDYPFARALLAIEYVVEMKSHSWAHKVPILIYIYMKRKTDKTFIHSIDGR